MNIFGKIVLLWVSLVVALVTGTISFDLSFNDLPKTSGVGMMLGVCLLLSFTPIFIAAVFTFFSILYTFLPGRRLP